MEVDDGSLRNEKDVSTLKWGNIVGALGWNYEISDNLFSELTLAYTKYNSSLRQESGSTLSKDDIIVKDDYRDYRSNNSINDISTRVDFGWNPSSLIKVDFWRRCDFPLFHASENKGHSQENGRHRKLCHF